MYSFPDPVPQTRIRILVTTYVVCFVGVVGRQPWLCTAVGWSFRFCFCVPILFRFTSKKFVYLIKNIKEDMFELYVYKLNFSRFRIWCDDMPTAVPVYCHCLGFCSSQPLPPPHCLCQEGEGGCCSNLIRYV